MTPAGKPAAMVHCNNCTSDLDAWVSLFREVSELLGGDTKKPKVYDALYYKALEGGSGLRRPDFLQLRFRRADYRL